MNPEPKAPLECALDDIEAIRDALKGDAGRKFLERVERLEWAALKAKRLRDAVFERGLNRNLGTEVYALGIALNALERKP